MHIAQCMHIAIHMARLRLNFIALQGTKSSCKLNFGITCFIYCQIYFHCWNIWPFKLIWYNFCCLQGTAFKFCKLWNRFWHYSIDCQNCLPLLTNFEIVLLYSRRLYLILYCTHLLNCKCTLTQINCTVLHNIHKYKFE